jgi:hypothetical protein
MESTNLDDLIVLADLQLFRKTVVEHRTTPGGASTWSQSTPEDAAYLAAVGQLTATCRLLTDTCRLLTGTVRQSTDTVGQSTGTVRQSTDTVGQSTDTVRQLADTVRQLADTVRQLADTVRQSTRHCRTVDRHCQTVGRHCRQVDGDCRPVDWVCDAARGRGYLHGSIAPWPQKGTLATPHSDSEEMEGSAGVGARRRA